MKKINISVFFLAVELGMSGAFLAAQAGASSTNLGTITAPLPAPTSGLQKVIIGGGPVTTSPVATPPIAVLPSKPAPVASSSAGTGISCVSTGVTY